MSSATVYVIRNQAGLFLNKQQEWVPARENQSLYRTTHRDEAINTVFEVSSKDIYLRAEAIACGVDSKGQPLPPSEASADLVSQPLAVQVPAEAIDSDAGIEELDVDAVSELAATDDRNFAPQSEDASPLTTPDA